MQPNDGSGPYRRVWEAFQRTETTADGRHDTPYWRAHTAPYAASIIRVPARALAPDLGALRHDLAHLSGVRLHPDHFLHVMIQELGFVVDRPGRPDEISAARLEEFAQAAAEPISRFSPFPVALGGVNSFQDAIFLEVRRGEPLGPIHERLFDLAAIPHVSPYHYLPHCTIAHYEGAVSPREAAELLTPWRTDIFGQFTASEIEIVTINTGEPYPELDTYAVIPLRT